MIYVIDKAVSKDIHVVFNSSLLKIVRLIFPNENIQFASEEIHGHLVNEMLNDTSGLVSFKKIEIKNSHSKGFIKIFQWLAKIVADFFFFIDLFKTLKKDKGSFAILNVPPISFLYFKLIKFFYPKQTIYLLLHGELEYLYHSNNTREKFIGFFYKIMFLLKGRNMKYVVFNKIAKSYIVEDGYAKPNQVIEIEHPYIYNDNETINSLEENNLVFANIGSLMIRKRGEKIFELADLLKSEILNKSIIVCTIGKVDAELLNFDNHLVEGIKTSTDSLSRSDFEKQINRIHYSLFFFDKNHFIFRASGALMDAINFAKPIIAIKHPLFTSLFAQHGALGYLCNDIEDMASLIKNIDKNKMKFESEYLHQVANLQKLKKNLSLESIAHDFKVQNES